MTEFPIHRLSKMFPAMSATDFERLKRDIQQNGIRERITLHDGQVIDGRHRQKAMLALGIDPAQHCRNLEDTDDLLAYVSSMNLQRRHLSASQRATLAVKVESARTKAMLKKLAESPAGAPVQNCTQSTAKELAAAAGTSVRTIKTARHVDARADEAVSDALVDGALSLGDAEKLVDAVPDHDEQRAILERGPDAVREATRKAPADHQEAAHDAAQHDGDDVGHCDAPETPDDAGDVVKPKPVETNYLAEFKALWALADDAGKHAIRLFVEEELGTT